MNKRRVREDGLENFSNRTKHCKERGVPRVGETGN
jgi:hypothetical protein